MREPSQSSLKCPQSVVNTESLHRTFQHTVHRVHICCVACSTVILLSFDRSPHLITSCCRALPSSLAKASLSMDEAGRQTSSHSLCSAASSSSAAVRRPGSSQRQHRRTGSVGTVSEHEVTEALGLAQSTCDLCSSLSVAYYCLHFLFAAIVSRKLWSHNASYSFY